MGFISILLFFLYTYCFGFALTKFLKNSEDFFERNIMRLGIGLAAFIVIGIILNAVGIPLDWRIFLALSLLPALAIAAKDFISERKISKLSVKKSDIFTLVAVLIFLFSIYMYAGGAFKYQYLEDEDPWGHSVGAKYVSIEKKAFDTPQYNFAYIDPYPPGYDILMGVLHQIEPSVQFTLKFFNALIISLGILWFFFMSRHFVGSGKAAFATFVLAMIPSYFTHFIWAHTLVIALFFPAMYAFWMIKEQRLWVFPAAVAVASILLSQPDQPIKLAVMFFAFVVVRAWYEKKFPVYEFAAGILGVLLSLAWWAFKAGSMFKYAMGIGVGGSAFNAAGGSASRAYSLSDFAFPSQTLINVPPGFGIVVSLLLVLGLVVAALSYKKLIKCEKPWLAVVLLWFLFTFLGTNSVTFHLPVGLNPFRFWLLLAIPVAILAAEGAWFVSSLIKLPSSVKLGIIVVIAAGIFMTSGLYKYSINTSPGWYTALDRQYELPGYMPLLSMPVGTKVFTNLDEAFVIGMDKHSCAWCPEVIGFKNGFFSRTPQEISSFMKSNGYPYLLINALEPTPEGLIANQTIFMKESELANSTLFVPSYIHMNGAVTLFRVV